jgi:hypothetical protein
MHEGTNDAKGTAASCYPATRPQRPLGTSNNQSPKAASGTRVLSVTRPV